MGQGCDCTTQRNEAALLNEARHAPLKGNRSSSPVTVELKDNAVKSHQKWYL